MKVIKISITLSGMIHKSPPFIIFKYQISTEFTPTLQKPEGFRKEVIEMTRPNNYFTEIGGVPTYYRGAKSAGAAAQPISNHRN
jgi:hypothetical protein